MAVARYLTLYVSHVCHSFSLCCCCYCWWCSSSCCSFCLCTFVIPASPLSSNLSCYSYHILVNAKNGNRCHCMISATEMQTTIKTTTTTTAVKTKSTASCIYVCVCVFKWNKKNSENAANEKLKCEKKWNAYGRKKFDFNEWTTQVPGSTTNRTIKWQQRSQARETTQTERDR